MPVSTQLVRNGEPISVGGWSWWHLGALHKAMEAEVGHEMPLFPETGMYKFKEAHRYEAPEERIWTDGDVGKIFYFEIKPGDEYHAWR